MSQIAPSTRHIPILLSEMTQPVLEAARALGQSGCIVDCTLGGGGHSAALLQGIGDHPGLRLLSIDQDAAAVMRGQERFRQAITSGKMQIVHARMSELPRILAHHQADLGPCVGLIADLGFSSDQMDDPARGLSFRGDGPLDMRMDPSHGVPLLTWLRQVSEKDLADVIFEYGEERHSRRIASRIIHARREGQLPTTTRGLADLIAKAAPGSSADRGRIHPATRTFQALRIWINGEMEELHALLKEGIIKVSPGGCVAVLTFHSIEDRLVKVALKDRALFEPLYKKPLVAGEGELAANPRARSAKLRVSRRIQEGGAQ